MSQIQIENKLDKNFECEYNSLADILSSTEVIFKGTEIGGTLTTNNESIVDNNTPCTATFNNLFTENFITPAFVTLVKDQIHGKEYWFYQLDELYNDGIWHRRIGSAYLLSKNELQINETNANAVIILEKK